MPDPRVEEVLERLEKLGAVRARPMFGGHGLYLGGVFFGLVADGELYFRVDDATRGAYERAGSTPFQPFADKPSMRTYWRVPDRIESSSSEFRAWATRAVEAARARDAAKTGSKTRSTPKPRASKTSTASAPRANSRAPIRLLGPVARRRLAEAGVETHADLERIGSIAAYRAVLAKGHRPGWNLLYALEGALLGLRWNQLPDVVKANLRERAGP